MNHDLSALSEHELSALLSQAAHELEARREAQKKETVAKIRELARSIGVAVNIQEATSAPSPAKRGSVPIKYRDPAHPEHAWTGRGMKPKWLRALLEQGRSIEEFRV